MSGRAARRRAREFALQGIYQWLLADNSVTDIEAHMRSVSGFERADEALFGEIIRAVLRDADSLRTAFVPFLSRPLEALSPVEHAILLLSSHELLHCPQTPVRVVLNEGIELAKAYGGIEGHKFINGVLDKLAAQVRTSEMAARTD